MLEAVVHAIGDGTVVVQRGEDFLDLADYIVGAGDIQEGLLLAGEGRIGQVFRGRGRTHRHRDIVAVGRGSALFGAQPGIGGADVPVQLRLQRRIDHPASDFRTGSSERPDILHVQRRQPVVNPLVQGVVRDEGLERVGGGGETAGHRHTESGELADHLAERGVLAADLGEIGQAQVVQPQDVGGQGGLRGRGRRGCTGDNGRKRLF